MEKEKEWENLRKLQHEEQIQYLFEKIAALEDLILKYSIIFQIAQRKAEEFSAEATQAVLGSTKKNTICNQAPIYKDCSGKVYSTSKPGRGN